MMIRLHPDTELGTVPGQSDLRPGAGFLLADSWAKRRFHSCPGHQLHPVMHGATLRLVKFDCPQPAA